MHVPWWVGWLGIGVVLVTGGVFWPAYAIWCYFRARGKAAAAGFRGERGWDPSCWLKTLGFLVGALVPVYSVYVMVRMPTKAYEEGLEAPVAEVPGAHRAMTAILGAATVVALLWVVLLVLSVYSLFA